MRSGWSKARRTATATLFLSLLYPPSNRTFAQQPPTQEQIQKQEIYNLLAAQRFQQAEEAATANLAITPNDCSVKVLLGLALRGQSKLDPAFKAFHAAMQQCPQSIAALEGSAETAFLLNSPE